MMGSVQTSQVLIDLRAATRQCWTNATDKAELPPARMKMIKRIDQRGPLKVATLAALACSVMPSAAQDGGSAWGYNSYGTPGLIDMPSAYSREDGEIGYIVSHFNNQTRQTLSFQISKRLSGSFRYAQLYDVRAVAGGAILPFRFDRSFSLQYRFLDEGRYVPTMAIGINDLVGTGIYGGEYIVASKTLTPKMRATLGLGWGRLGTQGAFSNPLGLVKDRFKTRTRSVSGFGGTFDPGSWFHGNAAFFGGVEWQASDRVRLTAEYSSDDYAREDGAAFDVKSPLNFGVSYQYSDRTTLDARYLYGSELGIQLTYAFNPKKPRFGSGLDSAPPAILRRDARSADTWADLGGDRFAQEAGRALSREGIALDGVEVDGKTLRIQIRNDRYGVAAQAVGRAARILTRLAPSDIEVFDIRFAAEGMPVTAVRLRRSDVEDLEFNPVAPDLLRVSTQIVDAPDSLPAVAGRYPALTYGFGPYLSPSLFDPDDPLRADVGVALNARYELAQGLVFSGVLHQKLLGNLDNSTRASTSVLPRVRSEAYLYDKGGSTTMPELTAAYYFRPGDDLFGRVTAGYLEKMFGGISAELLWKRQNSRLALGAELNYVKQRDFDDVFGFRPYNILTGHVSAYYDIGSGYQGQLDVGRYLAGDVGATLSLGREFDNGWRVGAFATITDVSATDFGEGSFDKGIQLTIPLDWVTGRASKTKVNTVIRPVLRDGGARVNVSGRLYETVRGYQATELDATWGRFWR
jgi:hypothetical protein